MILKDIKSIYDVALAWDRKQKLIDPQGQCFDILAIKLIPNVGYKIFYQITDRPEGRYDSIFDNRFQKWYKIVLTNNKNKMEGYIERMIQEHKELVARIEKLHAWVYGDAYKTVHPSEFANECIQLKAMKVYEEALRARLFNAGIKIANGEYLVAVDTMNEEPENGDTPDND